MKAIRINPFRRDVEVIDGNIEELANEQIVAPHGFVDTGSNLGLMVSPLGALGADAALFWHAGIADFFGGIAFLIAVDAKGYTVSVPPGAWLEAKRAIEFLGPTAAALPRLRQLIERQMNGVVAEQTDFLEGR